MALKSRRLCAVFPEINPWALLKSLFQDSHVKVIDWGLGFYFKRAKMTSSVGSGAYAAPEVRAGKAYSSSCDLWSLGATACVMLSGGANKPGGWFATGCLRQFSVLPAMKGLSVFFFSSRS